MGKADQPTSPTVAMEEFRLIVTLEALKLWCLLSENGDQDSTMQESW